ncbi:MAG: Asp-tRNA(Asn)/Glu-tRNA(Gln) amidotransferase subunit GatA [Candidatus Roizmanbacteria bacterium]
MDVTKLTIKSALALLSSGETTSLELTSAYLERIEKTNPSLNAFITISKDLALEQASIADKSLKDGKKGKLLGIPLAYKDIFSVKETKMTAGAKVLDEYIPQYDATIVQKFQSEGAISLGKTNMDAWAHGSSGENSDYGPTKNPYDLDKTPGGSSSGSATAVASGMAIAATGTDTGGSIRLPAAFTGTVGLKPTYGRVSRYGIVAMGSSFDSIGHITRDVYDSAYLLELSAGFDPADATSSKEKVMPYTSHIGSSLEGKKMGIIKEFMTDGIEEGVLKNWKESVDTMKGLGCEIVELSLSHIDSAMACYYVLVPAEVSSNLARFDGIRFGNDRSFFSDEAKRRIMTGTFTLSSGYYDAYYKKASKVRSLIKKDFTDAFEKVDCIMAPVSPTVAFNLGERAQDPLAMYLSDIFVCPMNLAGVPALSVPSGTVDGLPVGVQFIAPDFCEERLYEFGSAFEKERGELNLTLKI